MLFRSRLRGDSECPAPAQYRRGVTRAAVRRLGPRPPRYCARPWDLDWRARGGCGGGGFMAPCFVPEGTQASLRFPRTHSPGVSMLRAPTQPLLFSLLTVSPCHSSQIAIEDPRALLVFSGYVSPLSRHFHGDSRQLIRNVPSGATHLRSARRPRPNRTCASRARRAFSRLRTCSRG